VLWPFVKTLEEQWILFLKEEQEILERNLLKKEADAKAALEKKAAEEKAAAEKEVAEKKAAVEKKLLMEKAIASGQFYRELSSCHSNSIVAELQTNKSGNWETVAPAEGWIEIAPIGDRACFQPWAVYRASKGEFLRWRLAIPNQWEVFSGALTETTSLKEAEKAVAILKVEEDLKAAAELKAKQEADAKAAAELKAKQEADAKAATDKAAAEKILSDAKAEAARILTEAKAATKKITITCMKGKLTKKVTAIKPKCPSGYKKKL
jgi:membrane protein involved in colicin uptake